jgi:hypothetical protein
MAQVTDAAGQPMSLPGRRVFWQWVWSAARPFVGWLFALAGAVALFVGWFGISGQALTAKQLPYLVSAGLTGIALFILAGVFLATDDERRQFGRIGELELKVDDLYRLFVAELDPTATDARIDQETTGTGAVALPNGTSYHRPSCTLVAAKSDAVPVTATTIRSRSLRPCRVCSPDQPTAG